MKHLKSAPSTLARIRNTLATAALAALAVAYHYESSLNARYESGQLINASALQETGYAQDWITAVESRLDK